MQKNHKNISIFLFHRVSAEKDSIWPPIQPKLFEEIITYLNKRYSIVQLENFMLNAETKESKKPYCSIVFDDGYKDYINYSLPILKKYNSPSSMYVVTNSVYSSLPPWTYVINYLFTKTKRNYIEIDSTFLPENLRKFSWTNENQKIAYVKKLSPHLKKIINLERNSIYEQLLYQFNDTELPYGLIMSWNDVREIMHNGTEVGSHTVSHPLLSQTLYTSRIYTELENSAKVIEKETGKFPLSISYPFGDSDYRVIKSAKEIGYTIGLGVKAQSFNSHKNDVFNIPRIELYNENFYKSKLRMNGYLQKFKDIFS